MWDRSGTKLPIYYTFLQHPSTHSLSEVLTVLRQADLKISLHGVELGKHLCRGGGTSCRISLVHGNGHTGLFTCVFKFVKSVTSLTPLLGFWTKKPGLILLVG